MNRIEFIPLEPHIGAEVRGINLADPLEESDIAEIRAGLAKYKVIFFRDQMISRSDHVRFSRYFGDLAINPSKIGQLADFPEIFPVKTSVLDLYNETLHSDVSYLRAPPFGAILRAITVPALGGDTIFANAVTAYEGLSESVKQRIEGLNAIHTGQFERAFEDKQEVSILNKKYPPIEHPIVRSHPDTGERILFVNRQYTSNIAGLENQEGRRLLRLLFEQFKRPEYQVRFKWRVGSIAFWDNRATQHCLVPGYIGDRYLERLTLKGDQVIAAASG